MRFFSLFLLLGGAAGADDAPRDPALVRRDLLARMDAEIDAQAARAHLEARLILDDVMPLPYLGIDAEPEGQGMKVTKVFPGTGAKDAGIAVGDVILGAAGEPTPTAAALGAAIRSRKAGGRVGFRVSRAGKESEVVATLGKRPEEDEDEEEQFKGLEPGAPPPAPLPLTLDFASDRVGDAPHGLDSLLAGHGRPGKWTVIEADGGGRALRQADGDATGIRFPLALVKDLACADAVVRVRYRYAAGEFDRAAGIVLRFRDPGNYLVARVNAVENDLRIFRTVNGVRRTLPGARVEIPPDDGAWHTLEFRAEGPKLTATLDGKQTASSYDTYLTRGRVGLWTKSDSVTDFADLSVSGPDAPPK